MKVDKSKFAKDGYLLIRNFFNDEEIDPILLKVFRVFSLGFDDDRKNDFSSPKNIKKVEGHLFDLFNDDTEKFINLGKQAQHIIDLWRLASSRKIEDLLLALNLDFPNFSVRPSMFFNSKKLDKKGHYWRLGDHQDWRSSQGSLDSVTIWYPYVNCDIKLGALEVIPGSHLDGLYECAEVDYYSKIDEGLLDEGKYIPVEMNKGDLLIFNSFLVHRSGTNSTNGIRWSSQLRFNNLDDPNFIKRKLPNPYIYKPFENLVEPGPPTKEEIMNYFNNFS